MSFEVYQDQLAEIEELLSATPEDESLPKLKNDLLELIDLTKSKVHADDGVACAVTDESSMGAGIHIDANSEPATCAAIPISSSSHSAFSPSAASTKVDVTTAIAGVGAVIPTSSNEDSRHHAQRSPVKKTFKMLSSTNAKILKEKFEIPSHLLPLPSDTEVERSRKRRTVKALKSKFRSKQKTVETEVRKRSWQYFMSKSNKKKGGPVSFSGNKSIFATEDGINAKVGVISGGVERGGDGGNDKSAGRKRLRHDF